MAAFGAYGKMPALGDFFRQNVAAAFVEPWDHWLQTGLVAARAALGERWQECYFSAPIWRFSLTAGLAGPRTAIGVLMPSVDRVGRHFPLTLVAQLPAGRAAVQAHLAARATFERLEDVALRTLDDLPPGRLAQALDGIPAPHAPGASHAETLEGALTLVGDRDGGGPAPALATTLSAERYRAPSIWSADLDGETRLMLTEGLPGPGHMAALFDPDGAIWHARPEVIE